MNHALLSPSSASRWLACTPSAKLESTFKDVTSEVAKEGTLAHKLGELLLQQYTGNIIKAVFKKRIAEIEADPLYNESMYDHADAYATFVMERFNEAKAHTSDALLFLEKRLDLTRYVQEGFGTGDAGIIADGVLDIIDLKYGKGVLVDAKDNKQMMLYALGWLEDFDHLYDVHTVRMTIYQPRIDNYSSAEIAVEELRTWAETELRPLAALAYKGEGEFKAGEHCRFCKVKATCKANADYNLQLAKYDFKAPELLTDEEIVDILARADLFSSWLKAIDEYTLSEAVNNNKKWPGHKLVEGRSVRQYSDESEVAHKLVVHGMKTDDIYTKKLLGITAMEKLIGKKDFNTWLSDLIVKPPGKPTLVPASDKRPEYHSNESAVKEFENVHT